MNRPKVGLIGIVSEEAKSDFWGVMKRVADIGYRGIEAPGGLLIGDPAENLKRFHDLGLTVLTVSANKDRLRDNLDEIIRDARTLQSPRVSMWWSTCESRESVLEDAALYNAAGKRLADEGIALCYHNHAQEFRRVYNGVYALDILAEHTDPAAVSFELDIAWITFGGEDPARVIRRLAGRVPSIHIKDLVSMAEPPQFTSVGTGIVDIRSAIDAASETGVEWAVVEQDHLRNLTPFETITVSYLNLKEAGLINTDPL